MKAVILAGGLGSRLAEETDVRPKPMVEIGDQPILWHIMKHYAHFEIAEFLVCLGYKGELIKRYLTIDTAAQPPAWPFPAWPFEERALDQNVTHWPDAWLLRR